MKGIYKITSPSKRVYIGQSINIKERFRRYKSMKGFERQIKLHRSFLKYGVHKHKFEVIHESECPDERNALEAYYVLLFNAMDPLCGLNCKEDGKHAPLTEETKRKIGLAHKGNTYRLGMPLSEETKKKIGDANRGRKWAPGRKQVINPESLAIFKERIKGNKWWVGRKHTDEAKAKISAYRQTFKHSPETIEKMKTAHAKVRPNQMKWILNFETGIFYLGVLEASESIGVELGVMYGMLRNRPANKNKPLKYV